MSYSRVVNKLYNTIVGSIYNFIQKAARVFIKIINTFLYKIINKNGVILAYWWKRDPINNWGDAINPILISHISNKKVLHIDKIININNDPVYSVVGSILQNYNGSNFFVWGSGFISSSAKLRVIPKRIFAVRGPLTRNMLINQGIHCPEIYGDPALLYPIIYNPLIKKIYKLGVIPHYIDKKSELLKIFINNPDVLIIDIVDDINVVIENISSCELIASSSLHGLVASDAYRVPSVWVEFSSNILGGRFKYYDYFLSVNRYNEKPIIINDSTTVQDLLYAKREYKIKIDLIKLLEVCPFLNDISKKEFITKLEIIAKNT